MKRFVYVTTLVLLVSLPLAEWAQAQRPMTVEDVLTLEQISNVRISPDGRWVAYVVTVQDIEENVSDSDLWVVT